MFEFLQDMGNYADRKIDRTKVNGLTVSTAYTSDEGYETALIDSVKVVPVERYNTRKLAIAGHAKWVEFAKGTENNVTMLGAWGIVGPKPYMLIRG